MAVWQAGASGSHPVSEAGWQREPGDPRCWERSWGKTALKRLTRPEDSSAVCGGKALMSRAEPRRRPQVGKAAEAASGRGLGTAGSV